ncbi:ATP-binding protein [Flavobacteriaceae bacterium]|nr:ATP-binding protein [Flavobacteriaceae bacterium]
MEQQQQEILSIKNQLELLLREIHHRIKNNLQIISSFLGIQKRVLSEPQASLALAQSQSRIQTISYLHEQLYEQKGLEKVAVAPYFEKLISYIKDNIPATYEVSITNKVENHILEFDLCLSMGIVLNELVTNALKHAFTKAAGNTIEVVFKKTTQHYLLEVSDNGKGFSKQKLQQTAGLGHEIIDAIVKKINAELEISEKFGTALGVINIIPILGWIVSFLGMFVLLFMWISGLLNAINGKKKPLPILGKKYEEWLAGVFQ